MSRVREIAGGYNERISAAAVEVDDAEQALKLARARRNELMVEAVEQGMTQSQAARLGGIKAPYLIQILARAYEDVEPALP